MRQSWKRVTLLLVALMMTALLVINGQKQAKSEEQEEPDLSQFRRSTFRIEMLLTCPRNKKTGTGNTTVTHQPLPKMMSQFSTTPSGILGFLPCR